MRIVKLPKLKFLDLRTGEWSLVLSLLFLLALNTMVLQITNVVATAGFVSQVGVTEILWLWVVDMVITLITAALFALIVDRFSRIKLVGWLLLGFAGCYSLLYVLFWSGLDARLTYPLLYVFSDQQYVLFPLAFWSLANDVYNVAESKRLFPIIAAGAALGSIAGNALAALYARQGWDTTRLLRLSTVIFVLGFGLLWFTFRKRTLRTRQSKHADTDIRKTIAVGWDFIKNVPIFAYLAGAMLLVGLAFTIIEYHFLFTLDQRFAHDSAGFQAFYGLYSAALIVATWLFQWLVTGRLLKRLKLKSTFCVLPSTLVLASIGALVGSGILGGASSRFLGRLVQKAWDEPARKSIQGLIPDERRGRVSTFLDSYFYSLATVLGCLLVGGLYLVQRAGWIQQQTLETIYLCVAAAAAAGAIWATLQLRKVYDTSMLNWRLSRAKRKSILDNIEF